MANAEEITKAVGAHGLWKQRLRQALDTGKSDFTVERVRPDNLCDFGKWLHGLPDSEKRSEHWKKVQALHAEFHGEAAKVLAAALAGKKVEAEKGLAPESAFATVSSKLTMAMMAWKSASG